MKEVHCGEKTANTGPSRYSPEDKYGKYRRMAKAQINRDKSGGG